MPRICIHDECKKSKKPGNARYGKRTSKTGGTREYCPKHKNAYVNMFYQMIPKHIVRNPLIII
jgi:hypothetical protein